jgi:hypothetical protein
MRNTCRPLEIMFLVLLAGCADGSERRPVPAQSSEAASATATGDYRPPPDPTRLDACALLPPAEIERFGKVIEGPTLSRGANSWPSCSYVLAPNRGLVVELLESQWYDMHHNGWDPKKVQDIGGVGDKAFIVMLKPPSDPHLVAAKGEIAVKVTTRDLELAREAARRVLARF